MDDVSRTQSFTSTDHSTSKMGKASIKYPPPQGDSVETLQVEERRQQMNEYPEGGREAWLAVAGATACLVVSFGWVNVIGVFQEYYQSHQLHDYTPSEIAWIPSLQIFFMFAGGIFAGKVFDDFGPRYLLVGGTFLHVLGLMMTSISKTYYQILLSQAVCSAIGASMVFSPAFSSVSTWFLKKRGAALGIVAAGSSLGGIVFPVLIINLLPRVGFGWTLRCCAFVILALLLFANFALTSRIKPTKRPLEFAAFVRPLREPAFALWTISVFFFYWGMFVPFTFIVAHATAHGMSPHLAQYLVCILNATSLFGRTVPNAIADKVGHFNVMIVMGALTSILILALWLPSTGNVPIILFASLFGISSGAGISLTPALCAKLSPIRDIGVRSGTVFTISAFAGLTGSPIGGAIISRSQGSFTNAIAFGGTACAIGTMLFVATRVAFVGWKPEKV
ncbi:major facilitator superfamily transporter [Colletotrichum graminicola]|uniref:Major facilitator superfamily transporter n=1 Tax=Colletotrichum graminicola (strain M1.001 / M2 / FGSC 10212) TaxID=645133 RepID=E3QS60_COLGM|nr:major facilitator superfamily transporter [Colletotrichum graminicola M1.001]EFQ33698.1 major facilitator superfamily transporter [Colletotrichum graminicola M1.001]WDK10724.1 major facilitator superfamily transporter [Colletotrichum graminicola]